MRQGKLGPKTASSLLKQFGNLQSIIENADEIEKPSIRQSIKQNSERLINNHHLIKLNNSAGMPFKLNELEYNYSWISMNEVLKAIGLR